MLKVQNGKSFKIQIFIIKVSVVLGGVFKYLSLKKNFLSIAFTNIVKNYGALPASLAKYGIDSFSFIKTYFHDELPGILSL